MGDDVKFVILLSCKMFVMHVQGYVKTAAILY